MPIYEYRCDACGHEFETIQKMSEDPLKECPKCQAPELKKLISAAAFRLKGGGWYETDFKKGKQKNLSKEEKTGSSGGSGSGSEKSGGSAASSSQSSSAAKPATS